MSMRKYHTKSFGIQLKSPWLELNIFALCG